MAIVKKYKAEVVTIAKKNDEIYTIELKSLSGPFNYKPGQFLHLALDKYNPSVGWPESRCFSMQSSPDKENIKITFAIKGGFTSRMSRELTIGSLVHLKLPYGDLFVQKHSKTNTIFIAGGTGITPFLSLFTHTTFMEYRNPKLFFGLRKRSMNHYLDELKNAVDINPELEINIVYQDEEGVLNIEQIAKNSTQNSCIYISGPPLMIKIFTMYLEKEGVDLENIKTDDWV